MRQCKLDAHLIQLSHEHYVYWGIITLKSNLHIKDVLKVPSMHVYY